MSGCYCCGEPLSSYGFPIIGGEERKVCITCENWKHYYERNEFGTPCDFVVGSKVFVGYCGEWFKGRIYSIEEVSTPKGKMFHYLCYYEHEPYSRFDEGKKAVEDFNWFKNIKHRAEEEKAIVVDDEYDHGYMNYSKKNKEWGEHIKKKFSKNLIDWINSCADNGKQTNLFGGIIVGQSNE